MGNIGSGRGASGQAAWNLVFAAWLVAAVATLGALFFGEVMQLPPCVLCWYQRIFMFPLALILPPWEARLHGASNFVIGTLYIVGTFAPTHTAGAHNFALTGDRDADALRATNDVWPESRLYSWLCGGIN